MPPTATTAPALLGFDVESHIAALEDGPFKQFLTEYVAYEGVILPRYIAAQRVKQTKRDGAGLHEVLAALRAPSIQAELPLVP